MSHIHDGTAGSKKTRFAPKESLDRFCNDGREIRLLHEIYESPDIDELRGSPPKVIEAISKYAEKHYLMNVGPDKGKVVVDLILSSRPETMVELGGYCGYSAILFGDAFRKSGGNRYYSLERNPEFAAVVKSLVDLAGLSDVVKVEVGPSDLSLARLNQSGIINKIDFLFIDHYKPAYTADIKLCESLGIIVPGTVICADNCIKPGNPPYLAYVRSSVQEKREKLKNINQGYNMEGIAAYSQKQYSKDEKPNIDSLGNPNIVYDSKMIYSWEPSGEPDGVEYTRCVDIAES